MPALENLEKSTGFVLNLKKLGEFNEKTHELMCLLNLLFFEKGTRQGETCIYIGFNSREGTFYAGDCYVYDANDTYFASWSAGDLDKTMTKLNKLIDEVKLRGLDAIKL